jgi:hypothetical protein
MTLAVILAFVLILGSLAAALFFMLRGGSEGDAASKSGKMAKALAFRVGFSILLFLCLLLAWKFGLISPTGIRPGQ